MGGVVRVMKRLVSPSRDTSGAGPLMRGFNAAGATKNIIKDPSQIADPVPDPILAPEAEAAPEVEKDSLLKKKKKGRYSTILTGTDQSKLGTPDIRRKSLLGG